MVPIRELRPGMRIKIVDKWVGGCYQHEGGCMDKYLGSIVTVRNVCHTSVKIEEDQSDEDCRRCGQVGWYWHPNAIDYIVCEEELDELNTENISDDAIISFLFSDE